MYEYIPLIPFVVSMIYITVVIYNQKKQLDMHYANLIERLGNEINSNRLVNDITNLLIEKIKEEIKNELNDK